MAMTGQEQANEQVAERFLDRQQRVVATDRANEQFAIRKWRVVMTTQNQVAGIEASKHPAWNAISLRRKSRRLFFTCVIALAGLTGSGMLGPVGSTAVAANRDGKMVGTDRVLAHRTDVYKVRFYGGLTAKVWVKGDGDTDLDVYVYDSRGRLVACDTDPDDLCIVNFTPDFTQTYEIRIVNRGDVYNNYAYLVD
jgi:hypothetical protein